jgi:hypothetical protein
MKRAADELGNLVNYEQLATVRVLEPPKVAKNEIPNFILCQNFEKAKRKIDQTMERYNRKVDESKEKVEGLAAQVEELTLEIGYNTGDISRPGLGRLIGGGTLRSTKPGMLDNAEEHNKKAAKYNAILEVVRRLSDKKDAAVERHNEAVEKHNEFIEEAREKLEELTNEAVVVIDDDIVAGLDKCTKIAGKLAGSQNSEDLLGAAEVCFIALKIYHLFEGEIEGNSQRAEAKNRVAEVNKLLGEICASDLLGNHVADVYRRNTYLAEKNAELYGQVMKVIGAVNRVELDQGTRAIAGLLGQNVETSFTYEGVVDPSELDAILAKIKDTVGALNSGRAKLRELAASTKASADAAVTAHEGAEALLSSMKTNVQGMNNDLLLVPGHFLFEMMDEAVIDDFYHRELRPIVGGRRKQLVATIGEEQVDALVAKNDDRYSLRKAEAAIKQADLLRLRSEREKIDGHVKKVSESIAACEADLAKAQEVPRRNADAFRAGLSGKYILSCLPGIGVLFAFGILGKVKAFEAGFKSTNQIYRDLATEVFAKNRTMTTVALVLAALAGLGGLGGYFAPNLAPTLSKDIAIIAGATGGVLALLYLLTVVAFAGVGKRVQVQS